MFFDCENFILNNYSFHLKLRSIIKLQIIDQKNKKLKFYKLILFIKKNEALFMISEMCFCLCSFE
jgi:hypothetical protein